jgi:hypothetical protein
VALRGSVKENELPFGSWFGIFCRELMNESRGLLEPRGKWRWMHPRPDNEEWQSLLRRQLLSASMAGLLSAARLSSQGAAGKCSAPE